MALEVIKEANNSARKWRLSEFVVVIINSCQFIRLICDYMAELMKVSISRRFFVHRVEPGNYYDNVERKDVVCIDFWCFLHAFSFCFRSGTVPTCYFVNWNFIITTNLPTFFLYTYFHGFPFHYFYTSAGIGMDFCWDCGCGNRRL